VSAKSTIVTERHFEYIASHTMPEDAFLASLKEAALRAGIRPIWISAEQAALMHIILRLCKARDVIEVGTLAGYSAIAMARALPQDGKVHTIEIDPACARFAQEWIRRSDVADRVEVHQGAGAAVLPGFVGASADAMFLDADKKSYPVYLGEAMRILRPGGLVMVDNAFAFGQLFDPRPSDPEAPAIKEFNEFMAGTPGLRSVIVPIGDGCWIGVKD
jgi:predicted O-methyltransferase YrrM